MLHEIEKNDNIGDIFVFMDVDFNNSGFNQNIKMATTPGNEKKKNKKTKKKKK